jgi:hypothetical protein
MDVSGIGTPIASLPLRRKAGYRFGGKNLVQTYDEISVFDESSTAMA